jgi:hypothetical protein
MSLESPNLIQRTLACTCALPSYRLEPLLTTSKAQVNCLQPHKRSTVIPPYGIFLIGGILGLARSILVFGP